MLLKGILDPVSVAKELPQINLVASGTDAGGFDSMIP
jgi:hypothetical protein